MLLLILSLVTLGCALLPPKYPIKCPIPGLCGRYCGPNEHFDFCPPKWPPQICSSIWGRDVEPVHECGEPCCRCNEGYLRHEQTGDCITIDDCLYRCYGNEHLERDSSICRRTCANRLVTGPSSRCKPYTGCVCNKGYVRLYADASGPCIPEDKCPPVRPKCGPHEVRTTCEITCPPQTCESLYSTYPCEVNTTCAPGCNCIDKYLRNELGMCIPRQFCPLPPGKELCVPTCAVPNPPNCPEIIYNCDPGFVVSEIGGICINIEDCPSDMGCNGDPHARVKKCPLPCPSTCDRPNAVHCKRMCDPIGCECEAGYLLSHYNGKCILPEKCPGGYPCRVNETFVPSKVPCPSDYCPKEDLVREVVCETPYDYLSGCVCKFNYRRKSKEDESCILARECPPVKCIRQKEVWDSCPSSCLKEFCDNVDRITHICNPFLLYCIPRCICEDGYYRNQTDICVSPQECWE